MIEQLKSNRKQKLKLYGIPMASGITAGIVVGAAMNKIALGLVTGIIIGGTGIIIKKFQKKNRE
jgi:uncharacterized membrane protein